MRDELLSLFGEHVPPDVVVTPQARLREDLNLNSLSMMMVVFETERLVGHSLDLSRLVQVTTVEEFIDAVSAKEE